MAGPSDGVIETAKVREVAGVFRSHGALEDAVDDLLRAGFDRADIDVIGDLEELRKRLGGAYVAAEELADVPQAPRRPFFAREDLTETVILVASTIGGAAAVAAALAVIASEGSWVSALVAGAVTGVIAQGTDRRVVRNVSRRIVGIFRRRAFAVGPGAACHSKNFRPLFAATSESARAPDPPAKADFL